MCSPKMRMISSWDGARFRTAGEERSSASAKNVLTQVKMDLLPPGTRLGAADEVGAAAGAAAEVGPAAAGAVAVAGAPPPPRAPEIGRAHV